MKRIIKRLMPVLFAGMFMYSGCAKQEIVRKDEPLASSVANPAKTAPSKSDASAAKVQDKPIAANSSISNGEQQRSQKNNESAATADIRKALEKIYFDFDSSKLSDISRQTLTRNFETLKQNPLARIRIEGHCDERGSDEYNLALGERRARTAVRYLTTLGIPAERLSTISYGKEKPADPGHDEAAWAKNRRDEFVITK